MALKANLYSSEQMNSSLTPMNTPSPPPVMLILSFLKKLDPGGKNFFKGFSTPFFQGGSDI